LTALLNQTNIRNGLVGCHLFDIVFFEWVETGKFCIKNKENQWFINL
jgi:hypothetical protein